MLALAMVPRNQYPSPSSAARLPLRTSGRRRCAALHSLPHCLHVRPEVVPPAAPAWN